MNRLAITVITAIIATAACAHEPLPYRLDPVGAKITLRGRISKHPMQHLMKNVQNKDHEYFDWGENRQTVVYWTAAPTCPDLIELTGTIIAVTSWSKRGPPKTPTDDHRRHTEHQLDVATARCVD